MQTAQMTMNDVERAETQATARLIAAAPDLLEALKALFDAAPVGLREATVGPYNVARAAITKATGGAA